MRPAIRGDIAIAAIVALIVLIFTSGLATAGLLGIIVLLICTATVVIERRRRTARGAHRAPGRRSRPRPRPRG
jgi:ABC-type Fe3+ transport system permease subunit